jgi:hypothetical protein
MFRKNLRRWLLAGLLAATLGLPFLQVAAEHSTTVAEDVTSPLSGDWHNQVADQIPGGSGGGG